MTFVHELSGYELRGWSQGSFRHFYWSPAQSQIYRELERLEEAAFVEMQSAALSGDDAAGLSPLVFDWAAEIHRGDLRGAEMVIKHLTSELGLR